MNETEFKRCFGHGSMCNCIRKWRGRYIVTRRTCDCGSTAMTRDKAYKQAVDELGPMTAENHQAITNRVLEIERTAKKAGINE